MNCINWQTVFFFLSFMVVFPCIGFCAEGSADVNDVFRVGDQREIEVAVPKKDFIGAPPTPAAYLPGRKGLPKWDEDFRKRYVRITVCDKRKLKQGTRVVLRLDEIDTKGSVIDHGCARPRMPSSLYYAYIDVKPSGCRIVGHIYGLGKNIDGSEREIIGNGVLDREMRQELPFPLVMTIPIALSPDRSLKESGWMPGDNGVVYTESTKVADGRRVRAALIEKVQPSRKVKPEDIRQYSDKDKMLRDKENADSIKVTIRCQETQIWQKPNDWLWETMERTDSEGHILMRCRQRRYK